MDRYGRSLLYRTAEMGHSEVVQTLVGAGADIHTNRESDPMPLLHKVAALGHSEMVKVLVAAGADVNARDQSGMTPLSWAAFNGNAETVHVLTCAGAK